jgi:tetratricopeptide (TPR) repeat protein
MSTLQHEQALLFDRDLQRRLSALSPQAEEGAWLNAANALSLRSLPYLAADVTERGLALHPESYDLWMIHIQAVAISPVKLASAGKRLAAEKKHPAVRGVLMALVEYYLEKDRDGLARLERVPEEHRNALYYEVCGLYDMARQEYEQAVKSFRKAHRQAPKDLRLMYHLAKAQYASGDVPKAVRWLYRAVSRERHFVQAWNTLCRIHLEEGDLSRARQALGMALSVNPRDWGLYFTYADYYLGDGRYAMARAELQAVLDLHPQEVIAAEVYNYLGYTHYLEGRYDDALPSFQKALELNPSLSVAWFNMGNLHFHRKDMEQAKTCYKEALRADPHMAQANCQLGLTYLEQGILEKARAPLEKAMTLDPGDFWAHLGLSEYYRRTRDAAAALEEARQAMRIAPDDANVHNYLGIALETNRRYFDAEKAYRRSLELDPRQRWAANNLGYLYEKIMKVDSGYKPSAIEAWKKRLLICRDTGASVRGAINHLEKLGVPTATIKKWLGQEKATRKRR